MNILYFDIISGIAGDMIIASLLNLSQRLNLINVFLGKLGLRNVKIEYIPTQSYGISGASVKVIDNDKEKVSRHFSDIKKLIDETLLSSEVKEKTIQAFYMLALAEGKIHNKPFNEIHFHEVGGIDSIIDITFSFFLFEQLNIREILFPIIPVSRGYVKIAHGLYPAPAPATVELLKGLEIKNINHIVGENITPTGIAILKTAGKQITGLPTMKIEETGYGIGTRDFGVPNVLRVISGNSIYYPKTQLLIETNIDDSSPEIVGRLMEKLLSAGALDCFFEPVFMKKSRPAVKISVLTSGFKKDYEKITEILFEESSTIGLRSHYVEKIELPRKVNIFNTSFGSIRVKQWLTPSGKSRYSFEYEDLHKIAEEHNITFPELIEKLQKEFYKFSDA